MARYHMYAAPKQPKQPESINLPNIWGAFAGDFDRPKPSTPVLTEQETLPVAECDRLELAQLCADATGWIIVDTEMQAFAEFLGVF